MDNTEYENFLERNPKEDIIKFLDNYTAWLKAQLRVGALVFPPDDYYYIWLGQ